MMRGFVQILAFCLFVTSSLSAECSTTIEHIKTQKSLDQCLLLMQKRLAIMHEVARTKWNESLPIEDLECERDLLSKLVQQSTEKGLDQEWITKFFQVQFDAAKQIQKADFVRWHEHGVHRFDHVLDLKKEIRAYIDELNQELILVLGQLKPHTSHFEEILLTCPISTRTTDSVSESIWRLAVSPFLPPESHE